MAGMPRRMSDNVAARGAKDGANMQQDSLERRMQMLKCDSGGSKNKVCCLCKEPSSAASLSW